MNQNFEQSNTPIPEKFDPYINKENGEALIPEKKSTEQKSAEYAELQKEMVGIGIDKASVLAAMQELKGEGNAETKSKAMLETLFLGFGEKINDSLFDTTKEMYNIGKIIAASEFIAQDIKDSFINEVRDEFNKEIKSQESKDRLEKLSKFDDLEDFNEVFSINAELRKGYSTLVSQLNAKYSNIEVSKAIGELENVLQSSADGNKFLAKLSTLSNAENSALTELAQSFVSLEDAELYFTNVKDKDELQNFLASEKTSVE